MADTDSGETTPTASPTPDTSAEPADPVKAPTTAGNDEDPRPTRIILLPNAGRPLFPGAMAPFSVGDQAAAEAAVADHDGLIGVVQSIHPEQDPITTIDELHPVGVCARIVRAINREDDGDMDGGMHLARPLGTTGKGDSGDDGHPLQLLLRGGARFQLDRVERQDGYLIADVHYPDEVVDANAPDTKALAMALMAELKTLVKRSPLFAKDMNVLTPPIPTEEAGRLADMAAILTSAGRDRMLEVLATFDVARRLEIALILVKEELHLVGLQKRLNKRIEEQVNKQQHDFFLREQLRTIRRELGMESDPKTLEVDRFTERLADLNCPLEVRTIIQGEIDRLELIEPSSPEFNVGRTYVDWLTALPWGIHDDATPKLARARRILDRDHFGLTDVKERVLEYLAVHHLKQGDMRGSILCLVGPPGVGKTSMGRSIAHALGRKFFRFSLGGMRDEAEIKGHRRTYVGAMPGKLIQGLKRIGSANPVIMLDEIDKLSNSYHGDPSSALLEVLDPEQNHQFLDHYLDVPFDLSQAFFIATANVVDSIPSALLDRMEVTRLAGYIESEKVAIGRKYLVPKQLKEHGITRDHLTFTARGLRAVARGWSREAGVRRMERQIARTCRKVAVKVADETETFSPVRIDRADDLQPYLGEPLFRDEVLSKAKPGVAVGLAWTARGGTTLEVEAITVPGQKNGFKQTGQLGNVMVESSAIANSYVSSRLMDFGIPTPTGEDRAVHLHVPAGATPKDGPSAGITMGCALLSLGLQRPIRRGLGMTGELTLTGRVLPVGGIKEKIIAARRQGMKEIILPRANERDIDELPERIKKGMKFHLVDHFDEVARLALPGVLDRKTGTRARPAARPAARPTAR